jgi:hypothetical protein
MVTTAEAPDPTRRPAPEPAGDEADDVVEGDDSDRVPAAAAATAAGR